MCSKWDSETEKSIQLLFCPSLIVKSSVLNSSHTKSCRLAAMQTVLKAVWFPVCVTLFTGWRLRNEGTPECKHHSRWIWPLLTQIGWTLFDRRGQQPWNIIAEAHRLSFYFPKKLLCLTDAKRFKCLMAKGRTKNNGSSRLRDMGVTLTWAHRALKEHNN